MPTPIYPSWNDKEFDLLKKMTENTALIADYEIGDVASVAGTANQVLVNGGTAAATGNITLSLPSLISGISRISTTGTTTGVTDLLINPTTKASGNLLDLQVASSSKFSVSSAGNATFGGNLTVSGTGGFGGATGPHTFGNGGGAVEVRAVGDSSGYYGYALYTGGSYESSLKHSASTAITKLDVGRNSAWGGAFEIYADTTRAARFAKTSTTLDGNLTVSGTTRISDGTAAAPALSFSSDTTKGFYNYGANEVGLAIAGGASLRFATAGIIRGGSAQLQLNASTGAIDLIAGGTNQNITLTPSGTGKVVAVAPQNYTVPAFDSGSFIWRTANQGPGDSRIELGFSTVTGTPNFQGYAVGPSSKTIALQPAGGNLLIGTTTDGGQKLQVAGTGLFSTTESAVTLYATAAGGIAYQLISGGNLGHALGAFKIVDSSTGYVVLNHDKPTSGGTRLSFDGAGNATFAGTGKFATSVTISKTDNPYLLLRKTAATAVDWYLQYNTNGVELYGGTTPAAYFRVLDTGDATFAGNIKTAAPSGGTAATWRLGTVASVSPTSPNRTIEVEIGGTTYYIHAKTTNN